MPPEAKESNDLWGMDRVLERLLSLFDSLTQQYSDLNLKCETLVNKIKIDPTEVKDLSKEVNEFRITLTTMSEAMKRIESLVNDLQDWKVESKKLPEEIKTSLSHLALKLAILEKLDDEYFKNIGKMSQLSISNLPKDFDVNLTKVARGAEILTRPISIISIIIGFIILNSGVLFALYKIAVLFTKGATP